MPRNDLGNYLRERRVDLGLSQEQVAERIGGTASQAEISRLERGHVMLPRRDRMEALAGALEISLGSLMVHSGWLNEEDRQGVDALSRIEEPLQREEVAAIMVELVELREYLLTAMGRVAQLEGRLQGMIAPTGGGSLRQPAGLFDDWESTAVFVD